MAHMQDPILLRAPRVYMYIQELKRVPFPNHLSPTKFYSLSLSIVYNAPSSSTAVTSVSTTAP